MTVEELMVELQCVLDHGMGDVEVFINNSEVDDISVRFFNNSGDTYVDINNAEV